MYIIYSIHYPVMFLLNAIYCMHACYMNEYSMHLFAYCIAASIVKHQGS